MPDDRFFHKCLGHSAKVNSLTDFEDLVWRSYVLAADDFGLMRFSGITLRADNDRLARRSQSTVERALRVIRDAGLIRTFAHQGQTYCYQESWQDYQKITIHPSPSADVLQSCTDNTRWLFTIFPGGRKLSSWACPDSFRTPSGISPESVETQESLACGRALTLAKTNGLDHDNGSSRARATGMGSGVMGGALPRDHMRHSWCGRVCVPDFLHEQFERSTGQSEQTLKAFYNSTFETIPEDEP